ncbi:MAG: glutamine-hydrolyzing carbamoyl-phosphate synthase small subunit [Gammaproteobacteria bacterium]
MAKPALLALANGHVFYGSAIGISGEVVGEVVFNTSLTGYQEILTDPSYASQIVTLTYPHIGNVGTNPQDQEANRVWAAGLIIRDLSLITSNWRSQESLSDYLQRHRIVGIADIDTRRLTRLLREQGAQNGCILAGDQIDETLALQAARGFPGLNGLDLAKEVTTPTAYNWTTNTEFPKQNPAPLRYRVVVYDYGVKLNILRLLVDRGCQVHVVPAKTPAKQVLAMNPDGIVLSNGPGDPAACDYAIAAIQEILQTDIPVFGICLGHQLLALAYGAKTIKMKFGHHGANHPVQELTTSRVFITSQNHGFAVDEKTLPDYLQLTHRSLFDGTLQGFRHQRKPVLAFQGHPEASPGPQDIQPLFDEFVQWLTVYQSQRKLTATNRASNYAETN